LFAILAHYKAARQFEDGLQGMQSEASRRRNPIGRSFWRDFDVRRLPRPFRDVERLKPALDVLIALYAHFFKRRRQLGVVLPPYKRRKTWKGWLITFALVPALFLFCFIYGSFFALTAPYLIVPCLIPILLLTLLAIWGLPAERAAPVRLMRFLFSGFLISMILWPNYLAVALPGLPWITFLRLFGIPLALLLLVSVSISTHFRSRLAEILNATPIVWKLLVTLVVVQIITIPISKQINTSINKTVVYQINWTAVFIFSAYMFSKPGRIRRYIGLMCWAALPIVILSGIEFNAQHLLWDGKVPSFLKVDDLDHLLKPEFRAGTNIYRAKAMFSTALGLAEYLGILSPFFLHYLTTSNKLVVRLWAVAMLVGCFLAIGWSGSRLGNVALLIAVLLHTFIWAYTRWQRLRADLIAPVVFFGYPCFAVLLMAASLFVNRIHDAIWGGGAQASSNEARQNQIHMALPHLFANPLGYGTGMSGRVMGYGAGQFVTIDNYVINVALDWGVLGLIGYFGMFLAIGAYAFRYAMGEATKSRDPEALYVIPLGISISVFMMVKLVFSQADNDPILFMELGMLVALVWRLKREQAALKPVALNVHDVRLAVAAH
jgi:hypothetical protein